MSSLNAEVTRFLDDLNHPLRGEIDALRTTILGADSRITENIKWNGPNYCFENEDRITMRVHPPKQIQLIFHRGAKKLGQPVSRIIDDPSGILDWKENDRAVASFKEMNAIQKWKGNVSDLVIRWISATQSSPSS
jgi:hypothetical protein